MRRNPLFTWCLAALLAGLPSAAFAQRELHWDNFEVTAHLDAAGTLHVSETQTMVFTGEWNGGERRFTLHPRHSLSFIGLYRSENGEWQALSEDSSLNDVDDYAWTDQTRLRWRSRRATDPPFANTAIRYQLRYELSGILLQEGDGYRLDHDFAFRDRDGAIERFALRLTLDPEWQPTVDARTEYTAGPLPPGQTFVLNLPLRYTGAGVPAILDLTRPREIVVGVWILVGFAVLAVVWFFVREHSYGRFASLATDRVDEGWLREHILKYPAEVVGATWDEGIGSPEVVALIARMVSEGKLESHVGKGNGKSPSMTLRLKVDRSKLEGHERTLVNGLFFNGRTETSTSAVKAYYQTKGFNPASEIRAELETEVERVLPPGEAARGVKGISGAISLVGLGMLIVAWFRGYTLGVSTVVLTIVMPIAGGIAAFLGSQFRAHLAWGRGAATLCLIPALTIAFGAAAFLWFYAGTGRIDLHPLVVMGIVAFALALTKASIDALKSRQRGKAMAFRKTLAAGRAFFIEELRKPRPALRDEWYPWLLAFGLGKQMDDWSAQQPSDGSSRGRSSGATSSISTTSSTASSPSEGWTGFAGGRSGGAGGGASWQAAAGGMAAAVSPPSSSGSSGGSSSSGGGGSSSGGSSGGGGGGGW